MTKWAIMDGSLVRMSGATRIPPSGADIVVTPMPVAELARAMKVGSDFVARPASPAVTGSGPFSIGPCAAGTQISVDDLLGSERILDHTVAADDTTEEISLPDPGRYRIEVRGPLPAWPSQREVTVT